MLGIAKITLPGDGERGVQKENRLRKKEEDNIKESGQNGSLLTHQRAGETPGEPVKDSSVVHE